MKELSDRFDVVRLIGTGGAANVWLVDDHERGDRAALKVAHDETVDEPELRRRFEQEARLLEELDHPAILALRERSPDGAPRPWMCVDYMARGSLADMVLRQGDVDVLDLVEWTLQVLDGLVALHAHGVIHRDVKPDNVLVDEHGCAVLSDLGIARVAHGLPTQIGTSFGTPSFMAPEQIEDATRVSEQTDLYAVGVLMYTSLTRSSGMALLLKEMRARSLAELPEPLQGVVDRATRHAITERYQHADEMAGDLADALDQLAFHR